MTNDVGAVVSQTRYTAWGEVRYNSGVTPTNYTYTGQYSYTADFGLMFYNARWYDPSLGRFAQADTIVPGGAQGLDRYAYVNNNPVRYTDPSGHACVEGTSYCVNTSTGQSSGSLTSYNNSPTFLSARLDGVEEEGQSTGEEITETIKDISAQEFVQFLFNRYGWTPASARNFALKLDKFAFVIDTVMLINVYTWTFAIAPPEVLLVERQVL